MLGKGDSAVKLSKGGKGQKSQPPHRPPCPEGKQKLTASQNRGRNKLLP